LACDKKEGSISTRRAAYLSLMKETLAKHPELPKQARLQAAHQLWKERGHIKAGPVAQRRERKQPQRLSPEEVKAAKRANLEKARAEKAKLREQKCSSPAPGVSQVALPVAPAVPVLPALPV
jgi:hypothetical protein